MIDYAPRYDNTMCDLYMPPTPPPTSLDNFNCIFKKGSYLNYYSEPYNVYQEQEVIAAQEIYQNFFEPRENRDNYKYKHATEWTPEETVSFVVDTLKNASPNYNEIPYYNFAVSGSQLWEMTQEDIVNRISSSFTIDQVESRELGKILFFKLREKFPENTMRQQTVFRYAESDAYNTEPVTMLDLDQEQKYSRFYENRSDSGVISAPYDSSDDAEDILRRSANVSPVYSYSNCSDASKSGDEDDKRKQFKRPPGRPKGSGKKVPKRPRSVSVPEFLRDLLLNPEYCPRIIKWEDYNLKKFRFVKPDEVAKIWGQMKQNNQMTFEKFSRAMRYHYRQGVLVSVPTARLVYQFGSRGPTVDTHNPNFVSVKSETEYTL